MLIAKKLEVEANLRRPLFASSVRDEGDLSQFDFEKEIIHHRLTTCTEKLKTIINAIERLSESRYGICEECGAEISEKGLLVMPFAACCLERQEILEDQEL